MNITKLFNSFLHFTGLYGRNGLLPAINELKGIVSSILYKIYNEEIDHFKIMF